MSGIQNIRDGLTGNVTKVIVVAIIITFIGSVGWAGFFSQGNVNVVAKVGSQEITNTDLSFELSTQQFTLNQRFPDQDIDEEVLLNLSKDILINKFSVLHYLDSKGITLTDEFIYKQLSQEEQFLENGKFSKNRFDAFARSNGFIPSDYLQRVREDLLINIWRQSLVSSSFVTNGEVKQSLQLAEQERDITFLKFPIKDFKDAVVYENDDLQNFYENNKNSYLEPEKAKVSYITLDVEDLKDDISVSQSDIQLEYEEYLNLFDSTVRKSVSHVMLNITENRNIESALEELNTIKQRISNGEEFINLVSEVSEDEGTKDQGGSLGVTDGTLLPPEFEIPLNTMSEGEIFGPIELSSSVHLIRLDELIQPEPESLENRSKQIEQDLINLRAEELYVDMLDQVSEMAFSAGSLNDIASEISQTVINSSYFSKDNLPETLAFSFIEDFIFEDIREGDFPEVIETSPLTAVVIEIKDFVEELQLDFESVKSQVEESYINLKASQNSQAYLDNALADLSQGKTLESLSEENNIDLETYKDLKRDSSLLPVQAVNDIFSLPRSKVKEVFGASLSQNGDGLIYRLDMVKDGLGTLNEERIQEVGNFLNQQKTVSEIGELQLKIQESLSVVRLN
jgi:peptidyl-prolyl cis-trans isomerase D